MASSSGDDDQIGKRRYSVTRTGWILFVLSAVLLMIVHFGREGLTPYTSGLVVGQALALLVFSYCFAWVVWCLSRSRRFSAICFNSTLILLLLSHLAREGKRLGPYHDLEQVGERYEEAIASADSLEEAQALRVEMAAEVSSALARSVENSEGVERQVFHEMKRVMDGMNESSEVWQASVEAALSEQVADFAALKAAGDYALRRGIVENYIVETKRHREFCADLTRTIENEIKPLATRDRNASRMIAGFEQSFNARYGVLDRLLLKHVENGEAILAVLDLLAVNDGRWSVGDDQVLFDSDETLTKYNDAIRHWVAVEEEVNSLFLEANEK